MPVEGGTTRIIKVSGITPPKEKGATGQNPSGAGSMQQPSTIPPQTSPSKRITTVIFPKEKPASR
jgi:hypothetical protein